MAQSPKKFFIKTYGCQMNVYDSDKMALILGESQDLIQTEDPAEADMIFFNTCSIREKAQEKLFSELGRFRVYKEKNPDLIMGVGGCVASQEGSAILKRAPFIDVVFGPQTLHRLPELIEKSQRSKRAQVDISFPEIEKFDRLPEPKGSGVSAFLSIMEGCSKYCSYCVVPYTRGPEINRPFTSVVQEAYQLVQKGVKEITLLGQNVNAYLGTLDSGGTGDLALLIETLSQIPALQRIRFTTSHPLEFSDRLIDAYGRIPKLVNHLHLPVQSGSDRILSLMKRGYTTLEFKSKIRRLKAKRPDICLSSDFIVGFPGETEEDFQKTLDLVSSLEFDYSFSFIFSPRPGTPAATLPDPTPLSEKKERLERLQNLLKTQADTISERMVGRAYPVLVTGPSERNPDIWAGRTENNRMVHFRAPQSVENQVIWVQIDEVKPHSLSGTYLPEQTLLCS